MFPLRRVYLCTRLAFPFAFEHPIGYLRHKAADCGSLESPVADYGLLTVPCGGGRLRVGECRASPCIRMIPPTSTHIHLFSFGAGRTLDYCRVLGLGRPPGPDIVIRLYVSLVGSWHHPSTVLIAEQNNANQKIVNCVSLHFTILFQLLILIQRLSP